MYPSKIFNALSAMASMALYRWCSSVAAV